MHLNELLRKIVHVLPHSSEAALREMLDHVEAAVPVVADAAEGAIDGAARSIEDRLNALELAVLGDADTDAEFPAETTPAAVDAKTPAAKGK